LPRPQDIAEKIRNAIRESLFCDVTVLISDTDRTFSIGTMHFAARPVSMPGIRSLGLAGLLIGRVLGLRRTATPLASAGSQLRIEEALVISNIAEQARGFGAGRTAWDMARRFGVKLTDVTWEMLDTVRHVPIVIIRKRYTNA
jgi:F420-0:gamma-glutamyl ligase-like protein